MPGAQQKRGEQRRGRDLYCAHQRRGREFSRPGVTRGERDAQDWNEQGEQLKAQPHEQWSGVYRSARADGVPADTRPDLVGARPGVVADAFAGPVPDGSRLGMRIMS